MSYQPIFQNDNVGSMATEPHVDRLLGNAYEVVRYVAQKMQHVQRLSTNMQSLVATSNSLTEVAEVAAIHAELVAIHAKLPELISLFPKLTELLALQANTVNLLALTAAVTAQAEIATDKAADALASQQIVQGITAMFGTVATAITAATEQANIATDRAAYAAQQVALATTQAGLATSNGADQVYLATVQANLATTNGAAQVALATNEKASAIVAKLAAEAARDAAMVTGKVYATTAAGLAATTTTQYFSVPSPDSAESLILYLNSAGVAAEQKRYPSTAAIEPFLGALYKTAAPEDVLQAVVDAMGTVLSYIDSGGDLWLLNMPDSVQQSVALLKTRAAALEALVTTTPTYAEPHIFLDAFNNVLGRIDSEAQLYLGDSADSLQRQIATANDAAYRAGSLSLGCTAEASLLASDSLRTAAKSLDEAMLTPAYLRTSFLREATASSVVRFPLLLRTARNAITMLFCEINSPYVYSDVDGSRIMAVDLTLDERSKTITTANLRQVVSNRAFVGGNGGTASCADYSACRLRYGPNKGRVLVFFASNKDNPEVVAAQKPYLTYSDDNGATWTAPVLLAAFQTYSTDVYSQGAKAIQLKFGPNKGRIVMPLYIVQAGVTKFISGISDDYGATWTLGTPVAEGTNESGIAEDVNGDLLASVRKDVPSLNGYQSLYKSTNGGSTWTLVTSTFAGESSCQSSMSQASEDTPRAPKLLRAYPNSATEARTKLTVGLSYDGWATSITKELEWDFSAYSAIEMFNEQDILVAYEGRSRGTGTGGVSLKSKLFNINHIKE